MLELERVVGEFFFCASAAQEQAAAAQEAGEERTNCDCVVHDYPNYTYRSQDCNTYFGNSQSSANVPTNPSGLATPTPVAYTAEEPSCVVLIQVASSCV